MKRNYFFMLCLGIAFSFLLSSCGGLKIKDGNLDFLKGQKKLKVIYDYSSMSVGKFDKEEDYISKKVAEYNEKEASRGDTWLKAWKSDRTIRFQPSFENLINKYLNKINVSVDPGYDDAKYTMIIKTVHTEPGWNIYISRKPAHINVDVLFIETGKPNNILAKMEIDKVPGQTYGGYDFDTGTRLSESYAKLGKDLGKFLSKHF